MHMCTCIYMYANKSCAISKHSSNDSRYPPAPMNHVTKFKGWPPQDAPSGLVQLWYKTFPLDRFLSGGNKKTN